MLQIEPTPLSEAKCWVPNCVNRGFGKQYVPLPKDALAREVWVAMAGKKYPPDGETVLICEDHFKPSAWVQLKTNTGWLRPPASAAPTRNMPENVCRTCMCVLGGYDSFCVLSGIIPSSIPREINTDLIQCRPEPLYQILAFCIPDLNIEQDPPALVCYKCYLNIWMYFVYKITCNKVEKELCANLPPEQYGKMVLCRSCPQTTGTSFFILSEDSLKGKLLKKMFLNDFPTDVVPLKICLRCWNILYKLEIFYEQCHATDQKLQRHLFLSRAENHPAANYPRPNYAQDRPVAEFYPPNVTITSQIYDLTKSETCQIYDLTKSEGDTQVSALMMPPSQDIKISDVKTVSLANTWHPPVESALKIYTKGDAASNDAARADSNSVSVIKSANCASTWCPPVANVSWNASQADKPPSDARNSVPTKPIVPTKIHQQAAGIKHKEKPTKKIVSNFTRGNYSTAERIALVKLLLKYGDGLETVPNKRENLEVSLKAWSNVLNEMHRLGYMRSSNSIHTMWAKMKERAKFAVSQIGPLSYLNHLVINYLRKYGLYVERKPVCVKDGNSEIICLDDDVDVVGTGNEEMSVGISDASAKAANPSAGARPTPAIADQAAAAIATKKKRGRPKGATIKNGKLVKPDLSLSVKRKPGRAKHIATKRHMNAALATTKTHWTYDQKLAFARVIRKEFDEYLTSAPESSTIRSPWKIIMQRLANKGYAGGNFTKLYGLWTIIKKSATIHEKNGLDLVDEEVWDILQLQCAVRQSLPHSPDGKSKAGPSSANNDSIVPPPAKKLKTSVLTASGNSSVSGLSTLTKNINKNGNSNTIKPSTRLSGVQMPKSSIPDGVSGTVQPPGESGDEPLYHRLAISDKSLFLDRFQQEVKRMLENKESSVDPWNTVYGVLQKRFYKHYTCSQLAFLMTQLRRIAGIRKKRGLMAPLAIQNLDKKVSRIQALCLKVKGVKTKSIKDRDAIVWARPKMKKKIQKQPKEATEEKKSGWNFPETNWREDEKLALVSVLRSHGNEVFKKSLERLSFWGQICKDFGSLGYKRSLHALRCQWNSQHKSAKLAWAQQKEATALDKVIIEFMTEVIESKEKEDKGEDKEEGCEGSIETEEKGSESSDVGTQEVDGVDDTFDEGEVVRSSDDEVEMINSGVNDVNVEDTAEEREEKKSFESNEDDMELNYDYVSLQDIQRDYGVNIVPKREHPLEVIEILDSDEE